MFSYLLPHFFILHSKISDGLHITQLVAGVIPVALELVGIDFLRSVQGGDRVCELDLVSYAACCLAQAIEYLWCKDVPPDGANV